MARKKEKFEDMLNKLEDIVKEMDNGELNLEDSMKKYEEGIKLCSKLYKTLNNAEGKIKVLTESGEEDFN
ncbi:exodeoxyribonuclease VII small subunit [Clostridium oceanicum]|uniref:Exodeoxyribonuclease 7 small subunit n=1 Tax=Clostridium oceanicum TaxID=1543 RepID=A0ABN1JNR5_9CLOT